MLTYEDALNLNYYKKTSFTGWMGPIRFKILMEKVDLAQEEGDPKQISQFHAWIWPAPYIFDLTPAEARIEKTAPFTEDGKKVIVDWINDIYDERLREA